MPIMTAMEIAAIAAAAKGLAKELGVSVDLNQLASRVGISRSVGLLGVVPMAGGIGVGFALGVLFAPRSGRETRERLSQATSRIFERMRERRAATASSTSAAEGDNALKGASGDERRGAGGTTSTVDEGRWTGAAE
jgi:gas vesicle protein